MSKKKIKTLKREKIKTWSIHINGSTLSGSFNNVPVYELIEVLEGFIPHETEEKRLEWIKSVVEQSLPFILKIISPEEFLQLMKEK